MRKYLLLKLFIVSIILMKTAFCTAQVLLYHPQKIVIDSKRNRLLVSNDGNGGDLVQIDSLGVQHDYIVNADCIDGLEIVGDTVYAVGSNRHLYGYSLLTDSLVMDVTFPGATTNYLSSIAYDSAGCLFISCPKLNTIYRFRISNHESWIFAQGTELKKPNGMLLERNKNRIIVVGDSYSPSSIYAVSLTDSSFTPLMTTSFNSPDGIVKDKNGTYYLAGFSLTAIYTIDSAFSQPPVFFYAGAHMVYPTYDISDHSILITHYNAHTWERIPIASAGFNNDMDNSNILSFSANPNPFNTTIYVNYQLKYPAHVYLGVYNIYGVLVTTLKNEDINTGVYSAEWNGESTTGEPLSNGLYYLCLNVNGFSKVIKAVLVR